ncbi:MAG: ribose 5-phosphate isomerase B [Chloroflexi bacterium]|nr:ribose 5-phosphate isomerase B [Chloroflexota bacterium]
MRVAVAADHAGVELKAHAVEALRASGHEVNDLGGFDPAATDDYPDYAFAVGRAVLDGSAERAVLLCGSGVGASVAANKLAGIRAAVCHDTFSAHQGVEDDDMNVLCLGARVIGPELADEIIRAFLAARFSNAERHVRRLAKVAAMERHDTRPREVTNG